MKNSSARRRGRLRPGVVSGTTLAVCGIAGVLVLAGGAGLARIAHQPPTPAEQPKPAADKPSKAPPAKADAADPRYVLGFTVKDIDGKETDLSQYKGKVVVIVNVASQCGYTPQYEGLQKLYTDRKDRGLVVLAFPANNFGGQEPGSESEIKEFCSSKFGVSFPMFSKISVKGADQHELYKKLVSQPAPIGGDPKWNFTKFVVDRSGNVVARYDAARENVRTANLEKDLVKKVDELLAQGK
jgi:glutathione peroxidase